MFKLNQRVWSHLFGWGVVIKSIENIIIVKPEVSHFYREYNFWNDGKLDIRDLFPSLFHDEVKQWPNPKPKPNLTGEIFVSNDKLTWYVREFIKWNGDKVTCKANHPQTDNYTWNYYKEMK